MRVKKVSINAAVNHILLHNQVGPAGRKVLKKGQRLSPADITLLQELGLEQVYVAILADDDIDENEAAYRLGQAITCPGIEISGNAANGRVNLLATTAGLFKVNKEALLDFNYLTGLTLATLPTNTPVQPKTMVGTIKIIPYGVSKTNLEAAKAIATEAPLVELNPFVIQQAALIAIGRVEARDKVLNSFTPALRDRLVGYNTELVAGPYIPEDEAEISEALQKVLAGGVEMILVVGETSIMDEDDITPRAIKAIGGKIVHYGVPVEPGHMMLLAYYSDIPILGIPGCAKSKNSNAVDKVLPRLAAGERLTRRDLLELGYGGLLA